MAEFLAVRARRAVRTSGFGGTSTVKLTRRIREKMTHNCRLIFHSNPVLICGCPVRLGTFALQNTRRPHSSLCHQLRPLIYLWDYNQMLDKNMQTKQPQIHFSQEEFDDRQRRTRILMEDRDLDGLLLFKIEDIYWLTGFDSDGFVIFNSLFIGTEGSMTHLARAADLANIEYSSICTDVQVALDDGELSWADQVKVLLDNKGMQGKRIGIQVDTIGLTPHNFLQIQAKLEQWCDLIVVDNFVQKLRLVKSEQELVYHRKAGEILDAGVNKLIEMTVPGVFEGDLYGAFYDHAFRSDADLPAHIPPLGSGASALNVRYTTKRKYVTENDQLTMEMGLAYRHYHAGSMCTVLIGPEIDDRHLGMHKAVVQGLAEVQTLLRPGTPMGHVYDAYREVIVDHGYERAVGNACGYTMGAVWPPTWMEKPMFYTRNPTVLRENMTVFNMLHLNDMETGLMMSLGEQVIIREGEPEVITHVPREPVIVGA